MVYHVVNKSIAGYVIFNNDYEYNRFIQTFCYYQFKNPEISFSRYLRDNNLKVDHKTISLLNIINAQKLVEIIAYCPMPTHIHIMLEELRACGISTFISNTLNSYSRYFNIKHKRKGPLWEGRTDKVRIESDEQLLHTTRYIHLNPVTNYLVKRPEDWPYSSYNEYISNSKSVNKVCFYEHLLDKKPNDYKRFVEAGVAYQRDMAALKRISHE